MILCFRGGFDFFVKAASKILIIRIHFKNILLSLSRPRKFGSPIFQPHPFSGCKNNCAKTKSTKQKYSNSFLRCSPESGKGGVVYPCQCTTTKNNVAYMTYNVFIRGFR